LDKKSANKKSAPRRSEQANAAYIAAGVTGLLLAAWFVYGTVSIDPFRWGIFAEELIVALCALFALRLLCVIRLPKWIGVACIVLLPAGIALYGALSLPENVPAFSRALCIAAACAFALLTARQLDTKPDGVLLTALLAAACAPVLLAANTLLVDEFMRALIMAGVLAVSLAVRKKSAGPAYLASILFGLAGAAGFYAAFAGLGAGIGALLLAPKRNRGSWVFAAVLMAALPVAARFAAGVLLPEGSPLFAANTAASAVFVSFLQTHLLRALALGLFAMSARFFFSREETAVPAVLALAGCAAARLLPFAAAPEVWMDALPLCALAGAGVAKIARGTGR
jgi:hypothetical protein